MILTFLLNESTDTDQIYSNSMSTVQLNFKDRNIGLIAVATQTAHLFLGRPFLAHYVIVFIVRRGNAL